MKKLNLKIDNTSAKLYLNIADAIRAGIKNGTVVPGENLPSTRELAKQLDVNRHTVMSAYHELASQGWVETHLRQGYKVATTLPIINSSTERYKTKQIISPHKWRIVKDITTEMTKPASSYPFNFAGGTPDISIFPFNEFRSYMNEALNRPSLTDLNYGENNGFTPFIEQVKTYLRRVRSITNKEIIIVNGTQEALYILSKILLSDGDNVAVEELGYQPAWKAFKDSGANLIPVRQTSDGIDVEHLEKLIKTKNIKLLYLTPLHQYPTTSTLPISKRMKIYHLAQKYHIPIIEDDYDHEFHYDSQPLAPMAADDPAGLIIYLASFSKIMFPGCRLGAIAVDKSLASHIINYRTIINHKTNTILQDAVARWMKSGDFERHLRKTTRIYQQRRQCIIDNLNDFIKEGLNIEFTIPSGGMALWLNVGKNAENIARQAREKGIYLLSENNFHLNSKNNTDRFIRLGFCGLNEEGMTKGLVKLKPLLNVI